MSKSLIVIAVLLSSFSAFSFEMGTYENKTDDTHGCLIEILSNATSIKADGSCYTQQGTSYNILELVRTNYGTYEYTFEMGEELFINKIIVAEDLLSFKIYNLATGALMKDESLKKISGHQVHYYLSYFDSLGNNDVQLDVILNKIDK